MDDEIDATGSDSARWSEWPTIKQRTGVQHAVGRLLDALAPERPPARGAEHAATLQRLRSPRGCILQAATRAVSVSWFPSSSTETTLGELQVITWQGVVSRPGSARREAGGAVSLSQTILQPVATPPDGWEWRDADDTTYDTAALVARCLAMLDETPAKAAS